MPSPIKPLVSVSPAEMAARFFREALSPYGEWIELGQFGRCWRPSGVGEKWMPYTLGSWAYSRLGWTWISNEDFGGIVYHYGRWVHAKEEGWCWVPDLEWAASWVSWRYGTEIVGWSPLPPKAEWKPETGIGIWADREYDLGPSNYAFCPITEFSDPQLSDVIFSTSENENCFVHSVSITNLSSLGKSIFSGGPAYNWVASRARGTIPVVRVIKERSLVKFREQLNEAPDGTVSFKGVVQNATFTTVAPEWGILSDPRRADALGFSSEPEESIKPVKWVEGQLDVPKEPALENKDAPRRVEVLSGWESVRREAQVILREKLAKEVGGLTPANCPAAPFDMQRDVPAKP